MRTRNWLYSASHPPLNKIVIIEVNLPVDPSVALPQGMDQAAYFGRDITSHLCRELYLSMLRQADSEALCRLKHLPRGINGTGDSWDLDIPFHSDWSIKDQDSLLHEPSNVARFIWVFRREGHGSVAFGAYYRRTEKYNLVAYYGYLIQN